MYTAWYKVISRSFRRTLNKDGSLDLQKPFLCQEFAHLCSYLTAHHDISLKVRPSKVKETVFQTQFFLCLAVLLNGERRCLGFGKDPKFLRPDLDLSCLKAFIDCAFTHLYPPHYSNYELTAQCSGFCKTFCSDVFLIEDDLQQTGTVTQIHKDQTSKISSFLNPTHNRNGTSAVSFAHFRTAMGPLKPFHSFSHFSFLLLFSSHYFFCKISDAIWSSDTSVCSPVSMSFTRALFSSSSCVPMITVLFAPILFAYFICAFALRSI